MATRAELARAKTEAEIVALGYSHAFAWHLLQARKRKLVNSALGRGKTRLNRW